MEKERQRGREEGKDEGKKAGRGKIEKRVNE